MLLIFHSFKFIYAFDLYILIQKWCMMHGLQSNVLKSHWCCCWLLLLFHASNRKKQFYVRVALNSVIDLFLLCCFAGKVARHVLRTITARYCYRDANALLFKGLISVVFYFYNTMYVIIPMCPCLSMFYFLHWAWHNGSLQAWFSACKVTTCMLLARDRVVYFRTHIGDHNAMLHHTIFFIL